MPKRKLDPETTPAIVANCHLWNNLQHTEVTSVRLKEIFSCSICLCLMVEPAVLKCGHGFCVDCIDAWFKKSQALKCPLCRKPVPKTNKYTESIIIKQAVCELPAKCVNGDCKWEGPLNACPAHEIACSGLPAWAGAPESLTARMYKRLLEEESSPQKRKLRIDALEKAAIDSKFKQ